MKIRIGTRQSALALVQAEAVRTALLQHNSELEVEIVKVVTSGDRRQGTADAAVSDKKEWVQEIEEGLLEGRIDLAVHSAKDVPIAIEDGTEVCSVLDRESPFDCFVIKAERLPADGSCSLRALRPGAVVGTSSVRRKAQVLRLRPDISVVAVRGNVPTRLEKLQAIEELDALILARAGLDRLGLGQRSQGSFDAREFTPAVNQGVLAVQYRTSDTSLREAVAVLQDSATESVWRAERSCIEKLGADCNSCVGVYADCENGTLKIFARVLKPDGSYSIEQEMTGQASEAEQVGSRLAEELLKQGAAELLLGS
ncbi:MAG: hydroxymethylbilane synthase [Bdellovibrionales bacterium]|nr:hydroxymethylbilane synthase [Bdellovibrionales bacterium]